MQKWALRHATVPAPDTPNHRHLKWLLGTATQTSMFVVGLAVSERQASKNQLGTQQLRHLPQRHLNTSTRDPTLASHICCRLQLIEPPQEASSRPRPLQSCQHLLYCRHSDHSHSDTTGLGVTLLSRMMAPWLPGMRPIAPLHKKPLRNASAGRYVGRGAIERRGKIAGEGHSGKALAWHIRTSGSFSLTLTHTFGHSLTQ